MKKLWSILGLGIVLGGLLGQLGARGGLLGASPVLAGPEDVKGAWPSYAVREEFWMSVGVDNLGNHLKPRKVQELRQHINVPAHYGELVDTVGGLAGTVFWFKDGAGLLRNVVIDGPGRLYRIQRFETGRYEAEIDH